MANYILRPQEMKVWEAGIIRDGVDSLILMENAAKNMAAIIARHISPGRVGIFCGTGNNGGDGFALARHLLLAGFSPVLLLVGEADKLTPEARKNYEAARVLGILIIQCRQQVDFALGLGCDLLVDALFGTGLQRPIGGLYADAVQGINTAGKPVCAADIPSGIDADGQVLGCAVQADFTVTFQYKKSGLVLYPGRDYAGEVFVCDIGIPKMREQDFLWEQLEREDIGALLPERDSDSNKGDYGKLLVVAGSENMVGAAALCAKAAIRAGSGLTTIAAPQGITGMLHTMLWEAMSFDLPQQEGKIAEGCSRALLAAAAGKSAIA
ncbi:MAG: NAD(P)H-hydrate epimerase, partial [Christensenellales bacterium]